MNFKKKKFRSYQITKNFYPCYFVNTYMNNKQPNIFEGKQIQYADDIF